MASKLTSEENCNYYSDSGDECNNAKSSRGGSPTGNLEDQRIYNDISRRGGGTQGADHHNCQVCGCCGAPTREYRCGCRIRVCDTCFRNNPNCPKHPMQKPVV